MKILHYTLCVPSQGTGGLPKYAFDLMYQESKMGNEVSMLYPGRYMLSKKTQIIPRDVQQGIRIYEIINPQLVSLLNGISDPKDFYKACTNKEVYTMFIKNNRPDIIHIHTLMGLHKEFLETAKECGVKIIFTSHDYFGLCPKVNLLDYKNEICDNYNNGEKCSFCNSTCINNKLIYITKSNIYTKLKNNKFVYSIYKNIKNKYFTKLKSNEEHNNINNTNVNKFSLDKSEEYIKLRNYYLECFKLIDYFHFNSNTSKNEFKKYIDLDGEVISITHNDIRDRRIKKDFYNNKDLRITYLGPTESYKGFYLLKESLAILEKNKINNWVLNVYGNSENIKNNNCKIIFNGRYEYKKLRNIFDNTDLLIVPSIWKETFGFIGLEAISYGVPIMVTENIGMKDIIINNITGFIVKPYAAEISEEIKRLINNRNLLKEVNVNILKINFKYTMDIHAKEIINLYMKIIDSYV